MIWNKRTKTIYIVGVTLAFTGAIFSQNADDAEQLPVAHPECVFFGPKHDQFVKTTSDNSLGELTRAVTHLLPTFDPEGVIPGGSRTNTQQRGGSRGTIDRYLFQAMQDAGVTPAGKTTDWEFIRRVTLDLTGRIPTPDRVLSFVNDPSSDKRAKLIDELLAKPEWVDKWTMYYGDLFTNVGNNTVVGIQHYPQGRDAFYNWIKTALTANRS